MPSTSDPSRDTVTPSAAKCKKTPTASGPTITADLASPLSCNAPGCPCHQQSRPDVYRVHCPAHGDEHPSLDLTTGKNGKPIFTCLSAGCDNQAIIAALTKRGLWHAPSARKSPKSKVVASWKYRDKLGTVKFRSNRIEPGPNGASKSFFLDHPAPSGQGWHRGLGGNNKYPECSCPEIIPTIYRLPELLAAPLDETVFIVEGEKQVDRLRDLGLVSTTSPMGVKKWKDHYGEHFEDRTVVILPDNDPPGQSHGQQVAQSLHSLCWVKLVDLPGLPDKGDVIDWLENPNNTAAVLVQLAQDAAEWKPPPLAANSGAQEPSGNGASTKEKKQASQLIALAEGIDLWHTPEGETFATVVVDSHKENWPIRSKTFKEWLSFQYYLATLIGSEDGQGQAPGAQALHDTLTVLAGKALFEGLECPVFTRLGEYRDSIYLDLTDNLWRVVEVTPSGWSVISSPPIKFRRTRGMLALPEPMPGGTVEELRPFVNVNQGGDWALLLAWLISVFRAHGPYPVLALSGEHGSAKSTLAEVLRKLVDPNIAPLRSPPRNEHDLVIAAKNGAIINLDNLSGIAPWLSDSLCRLSTGGGLGTRELYENDSEFLFNNKRPVVVNGIGDLASRGDLMDRSIILRLPPVPDDKRKFEAEFWSDFDNACPKILGVLLDATAHGLSEVDKVTLNSVPRMADFAKWAVACETALGIQAGTFLDSYSENREEANDAVLEDSALYGPLMELIEDEDWAKTATELLNALNLKVSEAVRESKRWPKSAKGLRNALGRLAPNLRAVGVEVEPDRKSSSRNIRIKKPLRF